MEVSAPAGDPLQELFEEINALNRKRTYKQVPNEPAEAGPQAAPRRVGYFLREWSSEIESLIAAARTFAGPSSGSTIGGNGVTTEISDEPPAQPSNCASWCDPAVRGRQCELTAVSVLRNWGPFALISV